MSDAPVPRWLLDEHGNPDYIATARAWGSGKHPDQIAERERRARIEAEEAALERPKPPVDTRTPSSTTLYHGTNHIFSPGEMIEPRSPGSVSAIRNVDPKWKTEKAVYTTSSYPEAQYYAGMRANSRFAPIYETNNDTSHSVYDLLGQDPLLSRGGWRNKYTNTHASHEPLEPKAIVGWGESPKHKHISPQFDAIVKAHSAMLGAPRPEIQ